MNDGKLFKTFDFFDTVYTYAGSNTNYLFLIPYVFLQKILFHAWPEEGSQTTPL